MSVQVPSAAGAHVRDPSNWRLPGLIVLALAIALGALLLARKTAKEPVIVPLETAAALSEPSAPIEGPEAPGAEGTLARGAGTTPSSAKAKIARGPGADGADVEARALAAVDGRGDPHDMTFDYGEEPTLKPAPAPVAPDKPSTRVPRSDRASRAPRAIPLHPLNPAQIRRVISANERDIASCYEDRRAAGVKERILLTVVVEPKGAVSRSRIRGPSRAVNPVGDCIAVKARSWRFPAPGGKTAQEVDVPLVAIGGSS